MLIFSEEFFHIPTYVALIVVLFNQKSVCTTMKYMIRPKVWEQASTSTMLCHGHTAFPSYSTSHTELCCEICWSSTLSFCDMERNSNWALICTVHICLLQNPTWLHAFRTDSRQEATGKLSSSLYPMPSSVRLAAELFISCSSSIQGKHICALWQRSSEMKALCCKLCTLGVNLSSCAFWPVGNSTQVDGTNKKCTLLALLPSEISL